MNTAYKIREWDTEIGKQALYKVDPPMIHGYDGDIHINEEIIFDHVVLSSIHAHGFMRHSETLVFPALSSGDIMRLLDISGARGFDNETAITDMGYKIVEHASKE